MLFPAIFAFKIRNKALVIIVGTLGVWGVLIAYAFYQQWADPVNSRLSPVIAMVMGWFPGMVYSAFCVLISTLNFHLLSFFKKRRGR